MSGPDNIIELDDGTFMGLSDDEFAYAEKLLEMFLRQGIDNPQWVIDNKPMIVDIIATYPVNRTYWWHKLGLYGFNAIERNMPHVVPQTRRKTPNRRLVA